MTRSDLNIARFFVGGLAGVGLMLIFGEIPMDAAKFFAGLAMIVVSVVVSICISGD